MSELYLRDFKGEKIIHDEKIPKFFICFDGDTVHLHRFNFELLNEAQRKKLYLTVMHMASKLYHDEKPVP